MSWMPSSKKYSASLSVETVMPRAPAAICAATTSAHLWVLTCGRKCTPRLSVRSCMRWILRCIFSVSINAAGVSRTGYVVLHEKDLSRTNHADQPARTDLRRLEQNLQPVLRGGAARLARPAARD